MIYTDALQTLIMVVGAVILTIKGERGGGGGCTARTQVPALGGGGLTRSSHSAVGTPRGGSLPSAAQLSVSPHPGPARGLMESGRTISGPQSRPGLWPNCSKSLA